MMLGGYAGFKEWNMVGSETWLSLVLYVQLWVGHSPAKFAILLSLLNLILVYYLDLIWSEFIRKPLTESIGYWKSKRWKGCQPPSEPWENSASFHSKTCFPNSNSSLELRVVSPKLTKCSRRIFFGIYTVFVLTLCGVWSFTFKIFSFNNFCSNKNRTDSWIPSHLWFIQNQGLCPSPCSLRCIAVAKPLPSLSSRYQALEYTGKAGHVPERSIHPYPSNRPTKI